MNRKIPTQKIQRFSVSEKNIDIYDLLEDKKKDRKFNASDYICEAIRFFEENKNNNKSVNFDAVQKFVDAKLEKFKHDLIQGNTVFNTKINQNELLESGLDKISNGELDDD
jgi:hypothetical protein